MDGTNSFACLVGVSLYHGTLYGSVYGAHDMSRWHHSVSAGRRTHFPPRFRAGMEIMGVATALCPRRSWGSRRRRGHDEGGGKVGTGRGDCGCARPRARVRCGARIRADSMSPPPSGVPGRCTGGELMLGQAWLSSPAYFGREWGAADSLTAATDDEN